nr:DUF3293 domain-containing protein [uncultured Lichenicoccus sp.]
MAVPAPTPAILRSYRQSRYEAGGAVLRVGRIAPGLDPEWDAGLARPGLVLLSACNPGGRRRPEGWNDRMMRRLAETLRRVPHGPGHGRLGIWSEALVLAAIDRRRGIALARRFRQNAVIVVARDRRVRLHLLVAYQEQNTECSFVAVPRHDHHVDLDDLIKMNMINISITALRPSKSPCRLLKPLDRCCMKQKHASARKKSGCGPFRN